MYEYVCVYLFMCVHKYICIYMYSNTYTCISIIIIIYRIFFTMLKILMFYNLCFNIFNSVNV